MERPALQLCNKRWRRVVEGNTLERISAVHEQDAEFRFANSCGVLQHRLEDRLKIAGRAADDTEDLRGRGLLLKRFAQLVEQAGGLACGHFPSRQSATEFHLLVVLQARLL